MFKCFGKHLFVCFTFLVSSFVTCQLVSSSENGLDIFVKNKKLGNKNRWKNKNNNAEEKKQTRWNSCHKNSFGLVIFSLHYLQKYKMMGSYLHIQFLLPPIPLTFSWLQFDVPYSCILYLHLEVIALVVFPNSKTTNNPKLQPTPLQFLPPSPIILLRKWHSYCKEFSNEIPCKIYRYKMYDVPCDTGCISVAINQVRREAYPDLIGGRKSFYWFVPFYFFPSCTCL